jgi:hypothetical protein
MRLLNIKSMRKLLLVSLFLSLPLCQTYSQDVTDPIDGRDEIKMNLLNLIAFKYFDASYERIIDEESSFGVAALINLGNDNDIFDYLREFSITPYYRRYFSKGYAKGFFVEGFGMINQSSDEFFSDFNEFGEPNGFTAEKYTDFAVGVSLGGKFISKRGFVAEVYGGIGRNLLNSDNMVEVVGRGGISLGFRF